MEALPAGGTVRSCHYEIGLEIFAGDVGLHFDDFHTTGWEVTGSVYLGATAQTFTLFQQTLARDAAGNWLPILDYSGAPTASFSAGSSALYDVLFGDQANATGGSRRAGTARCLPGTLSERIENLARHSPRSHRAENRGRG